MTISSEPTRNLPTLLHDVYQASQRLATITRAWPQFMPYTSAVDECSLQIEGMRRTLAELREHTSNRGGAA